MGKAVTQEALRLEEPAATLWTQTQGRLRQGLTDAGADEWRIGGGTILAARWGHRTSFDIDVTVTRSADLYQMRSDGSEIRRLCRELGGEIVEEPREPGRHLQVRFENHAALKDCALDIAKLEPEPPGAEQKATIDDVEAIVLSSAQILRGKLERAERSPVRDVFDMVSAERADIGALAIAANCITRQQSAVIGIIWRGAARRFAKQAGEQLKGVPPEYRIEAGKLGERAAEALENAMYTQVRVYARSGKGEIEAECRNGQVNVFRVDPERFNEELDATGINDYLAKNAPAGYAARDTIRKGIENGSGDEATLVWSSESWKPKPGRIPPPRGGAKPPGESDDRRGRNDPGDR